MDFNEFSELIKEYLQKDKCKILNPTRCADIIESYHNKYVRQAYRTNAKIFQTNRRQVTLAATSIY